MKERALNVLGKFLGGLFVIAGVAKLPMFAEFSRTVAAISHINELGACILAGVVVAVEILGGVALLLQYKRFIVATMFCFIVAVFLFVLSAAIVQGREIQCNCFGILGVALSNRMELALDLVLLNLFAVLAMFSGTRTSPKTNTERIWLAISAAVVLYLQYSFLNFVSEKRTTEREMNIAPAVRFAEDHGREFVPWERANRLLMLLDFSDFNCPPCFDDFMSLCDSLKSGSGDTPGTGVLALFREGRGTGNDNPERLAIWARVTGLPFPYIVGPDSFFSQIRFRKSGAVIVDASGQTLMFEVFPMHLEKRVKLLSLLRQNQ